MPSGQRQELVERHSVELGPGLVQDPFHRLVQLTDLAFAIEQDDSVADSVEGNLPLAMGDRRRLFRPPGPQQGPDRGDQLQRFQDVGKVTVGAPFKPLNLIVEADEGGGEVEHRDRCGRRVRLDPPTHLEPAHVRQLDIEDHEVGEVGDQPEGFGSRRGFADREPHLLQHLGDGVSLGFVIVDDQDGDCRLVRHVTSPREQGRG